MANVSGVLQVDERLNLLPVVHGSADSAIQVRQWLLEHPPKCLAIPLPPSFFATVMEGVLELPKPSIVVQPCESRFRTHYNSGDDDSSDAETPPYS